MIVAARFAWAHSSVVPYNRINERLNTNNPGTQSPIRFTQNSNKTNLRPVLKCFLCNKHGHMASNCRPGRPLGNHSPSFVESGSHVAGNAALFAPNQNHQCSIEPSGAELKYGCRVPVMGNLCRELYELANVRWLHRKRPCRIATFQLLHQPSTIPTITIEKGGILHSCKQLSTMNIDSRM